MSSAGDSLESVVSSEIGLVTELRPVAIAGAEAHAGKQTLYRIPVSILRKELKWFGGLSTWDHAHGAGTAETLFQQFRGQWVLNPTTQYTP